MGETNGGAVGGTGDYRPRHAAAQLDEGLLEVLADATDQYRYGQLQQQYDAEFAIVRAQLFTGGKTEEDKAFIQAQRQIVAESIGRQAAAKAYADTLREQLYYVPGDGVYYHGRHRLEDRLANDEPNLASQREREDSFRQVPSPTPMPESSVFPASTPEENSSHLQAGFSEEADREEVADDGRVGQPTTPLSRTWSRETSGPQPTQSPETVRPNINIPSQGRLAHILDNEPESTGMPKQPAPAPEELPGQDFTPEKSSEQAYPPEERRGFWSKLRHAYYAGLTAVNAYFMHPEKGRRRRNVARLAAIAGGIAIVGLASWLGPDLHNDRPHVPYVSEPSGPPPNTEQFFDTIQPGGQYHGEAYEWTVAANNIGPAQATPKLLRLISNARDNGLNVDTWGNPECGKWGITSVTVELPDGTGKSYYDTPRKLAILQWYAGGMGPAG